MKELVENAVKICLRRIQSSTASPLPNEPIEKDVRRKGETMMVTRGMNPKKMFATEMDLRLK